MPNTTPSQIQVINTDGFFTLMCGNDLWAVGRYLAEKYRENSFNVKISQADLQVSFMPGWALNVKTISVELNSLILRLKVSLLPTLLAAIALPNRSKTCFKY